MGIVRLVAIAWLAVLLIGSASDARGQAGGGDVRYDSSDVRLRVPAEGALERYRDDPAFDYGEAAPPEPSWWDRMWRAFAEKVLAPLQNAQSGRVATWGLLLLLAGILVVALLRLLQMDVGGAFRRRAARVSGKGDDELKAMPTSDAQAALRRAEAKNNYRLAVRLHYLLLLREMDRSGLIDARPEKTNRQYVEEARGTPLYDDFRELTTLFDYVWYGEIDLDADRYDTLRRRFVDLHEQLRTDEVLAAPSAA